MCTIYYNISITGFKYFTLLYVHISKHAQTLLFCLFFQDGDFTFKKNRFLTQPSKKANCPARLKLREVIAFPEYKVFNYLIFKMTTHNSDKYQEMNVHSKSSFINHRHHDKIRIFTVLAVNKSNNMNSI